MGKGKEIEKVVSEGELNKVEKRERHKSAAEKAAENAAAERTEKVSVECGGLELCAEGGEGRCLKLE